MTDAWDKTFKNIRRPVGILYVFGVNVYSVLLPIYKSGGLFSYWVVWTAYIFWISTPYWSYHLQMFSSIQYGVFCFYKNFCI